MAEEKILALAEKKLGDLASNPYPGRGIVIGMDETGESLIQAYWIMGRSASSRNRVFIEDKNGSIITDYADPSQAKGDPELIIYRAMGHENLKDLASHVVSNGKQTDAVLYELELVLPGNLVDSLANWEYEPDAPNYTPRITAESGYLSQKMPYGQMVLLRKSILGDFCERNYFSFDQFLPGIGHCMTTYLGDGNPLPAFAGEPYLLPLKGKIYEVANTLWAALNEENRVALAVKFIEPNGDFYTKIINKYQPFK